LGIGNFVLLLEGEVKEAYQQREMLRSQYLERFVISVEG
jgi:hypothetical protein